MRRPHGLLGEMLMDVVTHFPGRLRRGSTIYLGPAHVRATIEQLRPHGNGLLVKLRGIGTPEQISKHRNAVVYVTTADRPSLPDGTYYHHQLVGAEVLTDDADSLGYLVEILETGANDVYVIRGRTGRELLLPVLDSVILGIDIERKQIRVHVPDGLGF